LKSAALLLMGGVGLWALAFLPCRWLGGEAAVMQSVVALGLTLLPALATLLWAGWAFRNAPEMQLLAVLGGSVFRTGIALGGAYALMQAFPAQFDNTLLWLLAVFYLGILFIEIGVLVTRLDKKDTTQNSSV
jgi:hypothetical protein